MIELDMDTLLVDTVDDSGQRESELTAFLTSLSEGNSEYIIYYPGHSGFQLCAYVGNEEREFSGDEATHCEFLAAVASSQVVLSGRSIGLNLSFERYFSLPEQLEEMVEALVYSNNFSKIYLSSDDHTSLEMAECVSKLLVGNTVIEDLEVALYSSQAVGREAGELLAKGLHKNRVLKSLDLGEIGGYVNDEGMEVLMKPLVDNDCVLQSLRLRKITDVGLEQLGVMLATNTSLKELRYGDSDSLSDEVKIRGYTSLREALCINRSLERLECTITSSMELKVLLEPLMPMNNNLQANTTLVALSLSNSRIGGKEGVDILADMICTNTSLSELRLFEMRELDGGSPDAIENTVAILEALKTNKSLKAMGFPYCSSISGSNVLGAT